MWYFTVCAMGESFNYILIHMGKPQQWRHITAITVSLAKTYTQTCSTTIKLLYRCLCLFRWIHTSHKYVSYQEGKHWKGSVNKISMSSLSTSKSGLLCTPALVPKHREGFQRSRWRLPLFSPACPCVYLHACSFFVGSRCLHRMSLSTFRHLCELKRASQGCWSLVRDVRLIACPLICTPETRQIDGEGEALPDVSHLEPKWVHLLFHSGTLKWSKFL